MTTAKPSLADQVAEAVLDILRECGPKYWQMGETETDRGYQTRVTWEGPDEVTLEHTETGHAAAFVLEVKARPAGTLPPPGPEGDGALQAELADAARYATEPQPELGGKSPADLILAALAAARAVAHHHGGLGALFSGPDHRLQTALDALDAALEAEAQERGLPESGHWRPATWAEVKPGQRVRVGGQHEATVEVVLPETWLGSGATQVQVTLAGMNGGRPYTMPPSGPVEVWTPALPDWAADAFQVLAEAGLQPSA